MQNQVNSNLNIKPESPINTYQISDDDDCDDFDGDDCLLEEAGNASIRGPYERAWTTEATRALIHIRGPMESRFTEGRQKRTALWLQCTRQMQKLGYRYSAAKVQKKWHNILITYNKNLSKKYLSGYVHWEFFEEMFIYLQGKKADCDVRQNLKKKEKSKPILPLPVLDECSNQFPQVLQPQIQMDLKSIDEFDEDTNTNTSELKQPKMEYDVQLPSSFSLQMPQNFDQEPISEAEFMQQTRHGTDSGDDSWWKDYFERKLEIEYQKIQIQKDMHSEMMQFKKEAQLKQQKMDRSKIDAINNLTLTVQKLLESKAKTN